jgi:taurine dioxygenase
MIAENSVKRMTPAIGAEVTGLDVNQLTASELSQLRRLWLQHKVLVIRNQKMSLNQLCDFSGYFGELMQLPYITPVDTHPKIICVQKKADEVNMGVFGGDWHSDFSFLKTPPAASILYAETIPPLGGDTLWANMSLALKNLPSHLLEWVENRNVIHTGAPYGIKNAPAADTQFTGSIEIQRNNPEADREMLHPAIVKHPDTGERSLFISPTYTTGIEGVEPDVGCSVLKELFEFCARPEFFCRLRWSANAVVIWDNRNTMHYAVNDYDGFERRMYRTTIAGQSPISGSA